jgi:hypothetical protein
LVATVVRETRKRLRELDACIGAPGPHDFAVRRNAARRIDIACVHRIPPRVRDDAYAPRAEAGREKEDTLRCEEKADYFSRRDWTTPIKLIGLANFVFRRRRFGRRWTITDGPTWRKSN